MSDSTNIQPVLRVAIWLLIVFTLYTLALVTYRLFFHPIRHIPGPKLAAATYWYEVYFEVFKPPRGQFTYELDRLHSIYGPVIRCSPDEVHIQDSHFYDVLFAGPSKIRERWERTNRANGSPGSVASAVGHDLHRMRRAALNPYFSKKAVAQLEESIRGKTELMCDKLRAHCDASSVVDIGCAFTALTLDVISEYSYDSCFDGLKQPDFAPEWKRSMSGLFEPAPTAKQFPIILQILGSLPRWLTEKMNPEMAVFFNAKEDVSKQANDIIAREASEKHLNVADEEKPKTVFHGILRANLPPQEKTAERLTDEAFVLIVAGAETTARVLTVILAHLIQNKSLYHEVQTEVRNKSPAQRLEDLPLLTATIQEGLRMASPVTNRPMLIAPHEDLECQGFSIPRGTPISMSIRNVLYDAAIYPNPERFVPDRWIEAAKKGERLDRYLVTFSRGTRQCVGMNLAYAELYYGVALLVSNFDMELYDFVSERDLDIVRDCFVGLPSLESKGVRVKLTHAA